MALLIALVAVQHIKKTPVQLALFYAEQLETADVAEIPQLIDTLVQMGDAGVSGLVKGLTSNREAVFTACLDALQNEFNRWQQSGRREHHFRIFSEALHKMSPQFSPAAQVEAVWFVNQMLLPRPGTSESTADRQAMLAHSERLLEQLENVRRRVNEPTDLAFAPQVETVAALDRRAEQPVLVAFDGFHYRDAVAGSRESVAEVAQINAPELDILQHFRNQRQAETNDTQASNRFLTAELINMPLDRIPQLTSTQLMQLLHHPEPIYAESARRTLATRDGFREQHMRLAWRLFHPIATVREEVLDMLPHTPDIQPAVWLTTLLDDPNDEVRFRTASTLATTSDPTLLRLLIERGRRDPDARIVGIANRLNESQRTVWR